jgi:hypothetical protein
MPQLSSPPQLPPLKPLERLVMGLTLLLLATPPAVLGHYLIDGWGGSSLVAEGAPAVADGNVVLAEHLSPSTADLKTVPAADR